MPYGGSECVMGQNTPVGSVDVSMVQPYGAAQQHYYHSEQVLSFVSSRKRIFIFKKVFLYCSAKH